MHMLSVRTRAFYEGPIVATTPPAVAGQNDLGDGIPGDRKCAVTHGTQQFTDALRRSSPKENSPTRSGAGPGFCPTRLEPLAARGRSRSNLFCVLITYRKLGMPA